MLIRFAISALLHFVAAIGVLVVSLSAWSTWHLTLRRLGPPTVVLGAIILIFGAIAFTFVVWLSYRMVGGRVPALIAHLGTASSLYVWIIVAMLHIAVNRRAEPELEGGEIALRASIVLAMFGVMINAVAARFSGSGRDAFLDRGQ